MTPDDGILPLDLPGIMAPRDVEVFVAEQAEAIRVLGRRMISDIIEIGERLIAVKGRLDRGEWLPWLERLGWSNATAYNFIAAADAFGKVPTVGNLPIDASALYLLSGPRVPETVRQAAVEKAEQGDRITKAEAEKLIRDARDQAIYEEQQARSDLERKLGELNARIGGLDQAIRQAADITNSEVKRATAGLRDQIAKAREEQDDALSSLKKMRDRKPAEAPPKPAIDGTKSFRSMCILQGIEALHKELRIPAVDAVSVHFESCLLTTEPPATRLGPAARQAREIVGWLNEFISEYEGR